MTEVCWLVVSLALVGCGPPRAQSPRPTPVSVSPPAAPRDGTASCACGNESCPATLDEALARLRGSCSEPGFVLSRAVGCGRVQLHAGYATEGSQYFYDQRDGRLVVAGRWFDVPLTACPNYPAGRLLPECPGARECSLCGVHQGMPACSD